MKTTFSNLKNILLKESYDETEFEGDGWDCNELDDSGLFDVLNKIERLIYILKNNTRASSVREFGTTLSDLREYVIDLADEMKEDAENL